jgi:hypothetical protein
MNTNWHVATAEAVAAAQFARFGFDVSVQYGAGQSEYDLMIIDGEKFLKTSAKGSSDEAWSLTQSELAKLGNTDYHGAADAWLKMPKCRTALCFVQFKDAPADVLPRYYLAWPAEVGTRLKSASGGRGDTVLFKDYQRGPRAAGAGSVERVPDEWRLTEKRVAEFLKTVGGDYA